MPQETAGRTRWLRLDSYTVASWLLFAAGVVYIWRPHVRDHEAIYLLGPRRVLDPELLANDLTWGALPPTTFVYDQLLAPLYFVFDDFGIAAVGRLLTVAALAWSLGSFARAMRLPPWSLVVGFALWLLWRQTLALCGKPVEGLQPKSLAYPMVFFSLAFAMRGQVVRAGIASGVGTVFHIIVGGWGTLALFVAMLANRSQFSLRQLVVFLVATAPFIAPLVLIVGFFHGRGITGDELALMDEIYVKLAQSGCVDPDQYMRKTIWTRSALILPLAPILPFLWPHKQSGRLLGSYLLVTIGVYALGLLANEFQAYGFLKLYPFKLANSFGPLFLLVMVLASTGRGWPRHNVGKIAWVACAGVAIWMSVERKVLSERIFEVPQRFAGSLERHEPGRFGEKHVSREAREMEEWIRDNTPADGVFITPYLPGFWTYAERAQLASFRHPPHDRKLIEWKDRLEALNGFEPFTKRGDKINEEIERNQPHLTIRELIRIRELYGATHYLAKRNRRDLAQHHLHTVRMYRLYDIRELEP